MTIIGSVFDSNRAPGLFVPGSALANSGELTIVRSTFSNNVGDGAALATTNGVVRINRSRFSKNFAGHIVGGLYILGGVVLMTETTFDGNGADGAGAVYVASDSATLIVNDSAFVENIAQGSGSGAAIANLGTVQVTNTTFARNIASTFFPPSGIAIANFGTLSLTNSTLDENTVGLDVRFAAVIFGATDAKTFLQNTILTHNPSETSVQDCAGPITSLGNNLIGDTSGCNIVLQPTDLTGDAGLSAFTDNGTPGNGHFPLLPTSHAIDAANKKVCPKKDQIGQLRKPHCDIGSIEFNPFTHHDLTPAVEEDLVQVVQ